MLAKIGIFGVILVKKVEKFVFMCEKVVEKFGVNDFVVLPLHPLSVFREVFIKRVL